MKIKNIIGKFLLLLTAVFINTGNNSMAFVGTEEMPKSMREMR
ncbi:hypothetical protein ABFP60_10975 [Clostridioides difficile]